jgi:hypothetical protein
MSTQRGLSYPPISGRHIIFSGIAGACQISGLNKEDVIIADCIYGYMYGKIEVDSSLVETGPSKQIWV